MKLRKIILASVIILPNPLKIFIYKKVFGWEIGKNVHIGITFIDSQKVILKDNVRIGKFTVIKNLRYFEVGEETTIDNFNHIAGSMKPNWDSKFIIGKHTSITSGHAIDVGGGVYIGDYVILSGMYSQIWSHEVSLEKGEFLTKPVNIGSYTYLGSGVLISPGATIPEKVVVGLGTVIPSNFKYKECEEGSLIVGNPPCIKHKKIKILKTLN